MFKNYINSMHISGLNSVVMNRKNSSRTEISIKGEHEIYKVSVAFLSEYDTLQLTAKINLKFAKKYIPMLKNVVLLINSRLLVGHFDLIFDDNNNAHLSYLFSQPFFKEYSTDLGSISKFIDIVVTTLNNCYPCFEAIRTGELVDLNTVELFMCAPVVCE